MSRHGFRSFEFSIPPRRIFRLSIVTLKSSSPLLYRLFLSRDDPGLAIEARRIYRKTLEDVSPPTLMR
jgi:hypothetical protein